MDNDIAEQRKLCTVAAAQSTTAAVRQSGEDDVIVVNNNGTAYKVDSRIVENHFKQDLLDEVSIIVT